MERSATRAMEQAFTQVKRTCFSPFEASRWISLGFCVWLANLTQGGGFHVPNLWKGDEAALRELPGMAKNWLTEHLTLVIAVASLLLVTLGALGLLLTWLSSRGRFMVLRNLQQGTAEVAEPWGESRALANRLFGFRVLVGVVAFLTLLVPLGVGLWLAWPSIQASAFDVRALSGILVGGGLFLVWLLALLLVQVVLTHFIPPIMWLRGVGPVEALRLFRCQLLPGNGGAFALFLLLLIVMALGAGMIIFLGTCFTCCLAALPVVGAIVFLPVHLFFTCYTLAFLAQFGAEWDLMGIESPQGAAD